MDCKLVTLSELPQVMRLWDYCFEKEEEHGAMKAFDSAHSTRNGLKWAFNMAY